MEFSTHDVGTSARHLERRHPEVVPGTEIASWLRHPVGRVDRVPISCVYCGGVHDRPAEVKQCWADHQPGSSVPDGQTATAAPTPEPSRGSTSGTPRRPATTAGLRRGPAVLGRHVVVRPGQAEPDGWRGLERVVVGVAAVHDPGASLDALRAAAHAGTSLVIELARRSRRGTRRRRRS
jgi:hypothetical protein